MVRLIFEFPSLRNRGACRSICEPGGRRRSGSRFLADGVVLSLSSPPYEGRVPVFLGGVVLSNSPLSTVHCPRSAPVPASFRVRVERVSGHFIRRFKRFVAAFRVFRKKRISVSVCGLNDLFCGRETRRLYYNSYTNGVVPAYSTPQKPTAGTRRLAENQRPKTKDRRTVLLIVKDPTRVSSPHVSKGSILTSHFSGLASHRARHRRAITPADRE